jgi:lipoprotein-anchoring transpeptidase ErfK/SrfK
MIFRTAGAIATLLIGLGASAGDALAQYYPPAQAYPPPQAYPPAQGYRPLPPVADADDNQIYDLQGRPLPPAAVEPVAPGARYGRGGPVYPDEAAAPPPAYRDPPPQGYREQSAPQGHEPAAAAMRPYYGSPNANHLSPPGTQYGPDTARPPLPISPGQIGTGQGDPNAAGGATPVDPRSMAALPPEVRPETGPKKALPPQFRRTLVDYYTKEPAGTLIVDTQNTYLYLVLGPGKALRYGIGVGREGFTWSGSERVTKMAEWPDWNPPEEMIERQPYLPRFMAGGDGNPLGARALYLGKTIYRIHGTNQPSTIGTFVSSGCIRLTNEDVTDLYTRVKVGTRVVVLPGKPPATAAATPPATAGAPPAAPTSVAPSAPPSSGSVTSAPLAPPPSAMAR